MNYCTVPLHRFSKVTSIRQGVLTRIYREIAVKKGSSPQLLIISIEKIKKVGEEMGLDENTIVRAIELYKETKTNSALSGKNPFVLAATCLYAASLETSEVVTEEEIAEKFNVTTASIRNVLKESFFSEKGFKPRKPKFARENILQELIPELPGIYEGIVFYQLGPKLHRCFKEKLKGLAISNKTLYWALKRNEKVKVTPGIKCPMKRREFNCFNCEENHSFDPCKYFVVRLIQ